MPDTRNVQSPYPRGQGPTSVPVLFALPNVQPVIAAESMGNASSERSRADSAPPAAKMTPTVDVQMVGANASGTEIASGTAVVGSGFSPKETAAQGKKLGSSNSSRWTNVTIVVLLVVVGALSLRNYQATQSQTKSPSGLDTSLTELHDIELPSPMTPALEPEFPTKALVNAIPVSAPLSPPRTNPEILESPSLGQASNVLHQPPAIRQPPATPQLADGPANPTPAPLLLPPTLPTSEALPGSSNLNASGSPSPNASEVPLGSDATVAAKTVGLQSPVNAGPYGTSAPSTATPSGNSAPGFPPAIDTDTPSLNTRDIILLRNNQRRAPTEGYDSSIPRVETVPRQTNGNPTFNSNPNGTLMNGQSYPPVRPQYDPISMAPNLGTAGPWNAPVDPNDANRNRYQPTGGAPPPSPRTTQPTILSGSPTNPGPAQPYQPLSPALPNPTGSDGMPQSNPPPPVFR